MTKLEAKTKYRWCFAQWLKAGGWKAPDDMRLPLEREMDVLQPQITERPGPEWQAFIDTIPGFRKAWSGETLVDSFLADHPVGT